MFISIRASHWLKPQHIESKKASDYWALFYLNCIVGNVLKNSWGICSTSFSILVAHPPAFPLCMAPGYNQGYHHPPTFTSRKIQRSSRNLYVTVHK